MVYSLGGATLFGRAPGEGEPWIMHSNYLCNDGVLPIHKETLQSSEKSVVIIIVIIIVIITRHHRDHRCDHRLTHSQIIVGLH